ncbi:MAG: GGDEF domain-containing protein [bacterium]
MNKKATDAADAINILIIETKTAAAKLLKKMLSKKQYNFKIAKNHSEAVKKLAKGKYEIVITKYGYIPVPFDKEVAKIMLYETIEKQRIYKERDKYKELSKHDGLTSLFNYRHFHEVLKDEIKRCKRYSRGFSVLMIDVDNFKSFNDTYGHFEGDLILKKISKFLMQNVRDIDSVYRYGGEEFTIILPETTKDGAFILAQRLHSLLPVSIFKTKNTAYNIKPTISIGLSCYPHDAKDKNELIKKADLALYEAKHLGKDRVCIFTPELEILKIK